MTVRRLVLLLLSARLRPAGGCGAGLAATLAAIVGRRPATTPGLPRAIWCCPSPAAGRWCSLRRHPAGDGPLDDRLVVLGSGEAGAGPAEFLRQEALAGPFLAPHGEGRGYWIGKYEVTREQWQAVMEDRCPEPSAAGRLPITGVSWFEAVAFSGPAVGSASRPCARIGCRWRTGCRASCACPPRQSGNTPPAAGRWCRRWISPPAPRPGPRGRCATPGWRGHARATGGRSRSACWPRMCWGCTTCSATPPR